MVAKICGVLLVITMFGASMAKPGYAHNYDVDYYVSVVTVILKGLLDRKPLNSKSTHTK
jgi:hypothetical protein